MLTSSGTWWPCSGCGELIPSGRAHYYAKHPEDKHYCLTCGLPSGAKARRQKGGGRS